MATIIYLPEPEFLGDPEFFGETEDARVEGLELKGDDREAMQQEEELMAKIEANDALVAEIIADTPLVEQEGDDFEIEVDEDEEDVGYRMCDLF